MTRKFALVIGNTEYTDPGLVKLAAPRNDADDFARVLRDPSLCGFDEVKVLFNELSSLATEAIDEFFDDRKPEDLLVLYFSGHGVRDELGSLYLAFKNTIRTRLRATAVKSDYIREAMDQSRSKRQVVILDCCNSGAFPQGTKAELGGPMGMAPALQGYGRFVLTASDATQFAWEGDKLIGEARDSLFTHFLVRGLEGDADSDGDGKITVDELYDYAFEEISKITAKQTPTMSAAKVEGEFVMRRITRLEDIKPIALPSDLLDEADDMRPYVRQAAVDKLDKILQGRNIGLARSAVDALQKIVMDENSTRYVAQLAQQALEGFERRQATLARDTLPLPVERKPDVQPEATVQPAETAAPASQPLEQAVPEARVPEEPAAVEVQSPLLSSTAAPVAPIVAATGAIATTAPAKGSNAWKWAVGILAAAAVGGFGLFFARGLLAPPLVAPTSVPAVTQPPATDIPIGTDTPAQITATPSRPFPYTVQEGDTLENISDKFQLGSDGIPLILMVNPLTDQGGIDPTTQMILPGEQIWLPNPDLKLPTPTVARPTKTAIPSPTTVPSATPLSEAILHLNYNSFCRVDPDSGAKDINAFDAGQDLVIEGQYFDWYLVAVDVPFSRAKRCWIFINLNEVRGNTSTIRQIDDPWGMPLYP
jgi:LysM repeat protein